MSPYPGYCDTCGWPKGSCTCSPAPVSNSLYARQKAFSGKTLRDRGNESTDRALCAVGWDHVPWTAVPAEAIKPSADLHAILTSEMEALLLPDQQASKPCWITLIEISGGSDMPLSVRTKLVEVRLGGPWLK